MNRLERLRYQEEQKLNNELKKIGSREGYERVYYYEGNHYVITGVGTNGFIISAYPKRRKD